MKSVVTAIAKTLFAILLAVSFSSCATMFSGTKADIFIDDRNVGGLPDWGTIYRMITRGKKWRHLIDEAYAGQKDYEDSSNYQHSSTRSEKPWWKLF